MIQLQNKRQPTFKPCSEAVKDTTCQWLHFLSLGLRDRCAVGECTRVELATA